MSPVPSTRAAREGPTIAPFGPSYVVDELVVGRGSIGARLGLDRADLERTGVRGPWILRVVFRRRDRRTVPWSAVLTVIDGRVCVRGDVASTNG